MKIFQIFNSHGDDLLFCHYDLTRQFPTLESTAGKFAPNIIIVEAPDYVFEGWGFDKSTEGGERFIKPTAPEGWAYDEATGTFYPVGEEVLYDLMTEEEKALAAMGVQIYEEAEE